MIIKVELEDFYLDEENLEDGLKRYITNKLYQEITKSIEDKLNQEIKNVIQKEIENRLNIIISNRIEEIINTEEIIINKNPIKIIDHIKSVFVNNCGWSSPIDSLKRLSQKFGDELKTRYDMQFASLIVKRLEENKMLKDDVIKILTKE